MRKPFDVRLFRSQGVKFFVASRGLADGHPPDRRPSMADTRNHQRGGLSMNRIATTLAIADRVRRRLWRHTSCCGRLARADNISAQVIHTADLEGDALLGTRMRPACATSRWSRWTASRSQSRTAIRRNICIPTPTRCSTSSTAPGRSGSATRKCKSSPGDLVIIPKGTPHGGTKVDRPHHQGDRDQDRRRRRRTIPSC